MIKVLLRLLPGAGLLLATAVALGSAALRPMLAPLVPAYPLVVLGGGILFGWRFDRSRLALALLVLLAADRALAFWAPVPGPGGEVGRAIFGALAVLVPLDLAALAWLPDRGLRARPGRVALATLVAQVLVVTMLCQPLFLPLAPARAVLTTPALVAFGLAALVILPRAMVPPTAHAVPGFWSLVAAFLAFHSGRGLDRSVYLATGGLVLLLSLIELWYRMAYDDELTGLPARRALNEALDRLGETYAVAMVDIDHFKRFNDEHGHDVGDQLLRMVGARLGEVGGGGRAYRYGGEEFAVLFPDKSVEETREHLEALRGAIEATPFTLRGPARPDTRPESPAPAPGRRRVSVTVSIGVAGTHGGAAAPEDVVREADAALYRAKQGGRNQVCT